ncbi:MAG: DUF2190 family protein [Rhodospirillaceae bacterium]|nr:DUF2190 family protein [Rhodospirillaceae bacterium]
MSKQALSVLVLSIAATAVLVKNRFITHAGAVPAAAARCLGVTRTDAAIGDQIAVDVLGTAVVEAGGAIAAGAQVEVDASGRVITKAAGVVVGSALQQSLALGDSIEVLLIPN